MADPPRGDRPQYKVYKAGSDAPARETAPPPGAAPQQPDAGERPAPAQQPQGPQQPGPGSPPQSPPAYRTYRSRKRLRDRILPGSGLPGRRRERGDGPPRKGLGRPRSRARTVKRAVLAVLGLAAAWVLVSIVLFFVSAGTQEGVSGRTERALSNRGSILTGSTILVLGSDARPKDSKEPGAGGPSRSDSILLMHVGIGSVRRLSIPRDAQVDIPGHGRGKINSAFSLGGTPLAIETVESYLGNGLRINHVIEVNFDNFPEFINALGGIDLTLKRCVRSPPFGEFGTEGGRAPLRFKKGKNHLTGHQALGFSRIRNNSCAPNEDDRARAERQQMVLSAIRDQATSPSTFARLPWVAWDAPRTVRSDMRGFGLSSLFLTLITGGSGETRVLRPDTLEPLIVSEAERRTQVRRLLGKDS